MTKKERRRRKKTHTNTSFYIDFNNQIKDKAAISRPNRIPTVAVMIPDTTWADRIVSIQDRNRLIEQASLKLTISSTKFLFHISDRRRCLELKLGFSYGLAPRAKQRDNVHKIATSSSNRKGKLKTESFPTDLFSCSRNQIEIYQKLKNDAIKNQWSSLDLWISRQRNPNPAETFRSHHTFSQSKNSSPASSVQTTPIVRVGGNQTKQLEISNATSNQIRSRRENPLNWSIKTDETFSWTLDVGHLQHLQSYATI